MLGKAKLPKTMVDAAETLLSLADGDMLNFNLDKDEDDGELSDSNCEEEGEPESQGLAVGMDTVGEENAVAVIVEGEKEHFRRV